MASSVTALIVVRRLTHGSDINVKGKELKVNQKLKKRIEEGYTAISKAMALGRDTTVWEKQIVRLEKRLVEQALWVSLTKEELEYLKTVSTIKALFSGAKVIGVRGRWLR